MRKPLGPACQGGDRRLRLLKVLLIHNAGRDGAVIVSSASLVVFQNLLLCFVLVTYCLFPSVF